MPNPSATIPGISVEDLVTYIRHTFGFPGKDQVTLRVVYVDTHIPLAASTFIMPGQRVEIEIHNVRTSSFSGADQPSGLMPEWRPDVGMCVYPKSLADRYVATPATAEACDDSAPHGAVRAHTTAQVLRTELVTVHLDVLWSASLGAAIPVSASDMGLGEAGVGRGDCALATSAIIYGPPAYACARVHQWSKPRGEQTTFMDFAMGGATSARDSERAALRTLVHALHAMPDAHAMRVQVFTPIILPQSVIDAIVPSHVSIHYIETTSAQIRMLRARMVRAARPAGGGKYPRRRITGAPLVQAA